LHLSSRFCSSRRAVYRNGNPQSRIDAKPLRDRARLEVDFTDIFEVRGAVRRQRGTSLPVQLEAAGMVLAYRGLDAVLRQTRIAFDPAPDTVASLRATWRLDLPPGGEYAIRSEVHCERDGRAAILSRGRRDFRRQAASHRAKRARRADMYKQRDL